MSFPLNTGFKILNSGIISFSENDQALFHEINDFIKTIPTFKTPKVLLEQYSLPSDLISFILVITKGDLMNKNVVDLGCGTGRFTLPIAKYFTHRVFGVDSDIAVINQLLKSINKYTLNVDLLNASVEFLEPFQWKILFQTTIMNPPFGTKRRGIDQAFLKKALAFSDVVLSIHKSSKRSRELWTKIGKAHRKHVEILATIVFPIARTFHFHQKEDHNVMVDLIRFF